MLLYFGGGFWPQQLLSIKKKNIDRL